MPELPEVETIRRQLDKVLVGQKIKEIIVLQKKSLQGETLKVEGKKIVGVKRKAKMIWIDLEGDLNLLIHLKMTGQLLINGKEGKHTRVIIQLNKDRLIFNDLRIFGWIKVVRNKELKNILSKLPLDVVDKEFDEKYLKKVLSSSRRAIKLVLLDHQKMGGVGNIYANDALFCAGINPRKPANKVIGQQERFLHKCLRQVIKRGIKYGGSTASDENYINALGKPGKYQEHFLVYENKGKCRRCQTPITKIKLGGRGTYFCPKCQP